MAVQLLAGSTSLIDVVDRVLDKGIVIDAWMRMSLVGLDLVEVEARVVVASINTYLSQARGLLGATLVAPPGLANSVEKKRRKVFRQKRGIVRGDLLRAA